MVGDAHLGRATEVAKNITSNYDRKSLGIKCDVSQREEVDTMIQETLQEFGRIDILVNNAGRNIRSPVVDMTDDQWELVINVNLRGTFYCSRSVLKNMIDQKSGAIVNISSIVGWQGADNGQAHYCAAKAGIMAFTKALAQEVAQYNIRVNSIAPGLIYNEFLDRMYPQEFFEQAKKDTPLGRVGEPKDIANAVVFLCSEESSFITGGIICVSGGRYMP